MQEEEIFMIVVGTMGLFFTIFWMSVAWRAMRAHEKLAKSAEEMVRRRYVSELL